MLVKQTTSAFKGEGIAVNMRVLVPISVCEIKEVLSVAGLLLRFHCNNG
jgi:hypothetical protein